MSISAQSLQLLSFEASVYEDPLVKPLRLQLLLRNRGNFQSMMKFPLSVTIGPIFALAMRRTHSPPSDDVIFLDTREWAIGNTSIGTPFVQVSPRYEATLFDLMTRTRESAAAAMIFSCSMQPPPPLMATKPPLEHLKIQFLPFHLASILLIKQSTPNIIEPFCHKDIVNSFITKPIYCTLKKFVRLSVRNDTL